jgi:hypothetical protein
MKNFDRLYLDKFAMDFDPEYTAVEDIFDFISDTDGSYDTTVISERKGKRCSLQISGKQHNNPPGDAHLVNPGNASSVCYEYCR